MDNFVNALKRHAAGMDQSRGVARWGTVQSVNPVGPRVKMLMHPDEVLTGWMPVGQPSATAGTSFGTVPSPGDQGFVIPDMGEANHGVVVCFAHSDASPQPDAPNANGTNGTASAAAAPRVAGEVVIVAFGSVVRVAASGAIYLKPGNGTVQIDGNLVCNGDVSDRHGSLDRLRQNYDSHKHGNVQTGGGFTGLTDRVDPE